MPLTPFIFNSNVTTMKPEAAAVLLEALGSSARLRIVQLLVNNKETGISVGKLESTLTIPGPSLNYHLNRLEFVNLIYRMREGRRKFCRVNNAQLNSLMEFLKKDCCKFYDR